MPFTKVDPQEITLELPWLDKDVTQPRPPKLSGPFPARLQASELLLPDDGRQHPALWRVAWERLDVIQEDGSPVEYRCVTALTKGDGSSLWPNCDAHMLASAFQKAAGTSGLPTDASVEAFLGHVFFVTYHVRPYKGRNGQEYKQHLFIPTSYHGSDYMLPTPPRVRRSQREGSAEDRPARMPATEHDVANILADLLDGVTINQLDTGEARRAILADARIRTKRLYNIPIAGGLTVIQTGNGLHWPVLVRVLIERGLLEAEGDRLRRRRKGDG